MGLFIFKDYPMLMAPPEMQIVEWAYRNPSAHTNMLQEINAKECMDLVIDVEKLLKRIIDSFDK